jgi:hypothetical protein
MDINSEFIQLLRQWRKSFRLNSVSKVALKLVELAIPHHYHSTIEPPGGAAQRGGYKFDGVNKNPLV